MYSRHSLPPLPAPFWLLCGAALHCAAWLSRTFIVAVEQRQGRRLSSWDLYPFVLELCLPRPAPARSLSTPSPGTAIIAAFSAHTHSMLFLALLTSCCSCLLLLLLLPAPPPPPALPAALSVRIGVGFCHLCV